MAAMLNYRIDRGEAGAIRYLSISLLVITPHLRLDHKGPSYTPKVEYGSLILDGISLVWKLT